jgi:uncharacterized protein YegL
MKTVEAGSIEREDLDSAEPRRLPVYLLLDVSASMAGAPIQAVNKGVNLFYEELMNDRSAIEMAHIAVIAFDSQAKMVVPLTALAQFSPPTLGAGDGTSLGAALHLLNESLDRDIRFDTPDHKGDYKPLVFLVIDGMPTDHWKHEASALRSRARQKTATVIALGLGCGGGVDVGILRRIRGAGLRINGEPLQKCVCAYH